MLHRRNKQHLDPNQVGVFLFVENHDWGVNLVHVWTR